MAIYKINAVRFDGCTKVIEVEAKSASAAMKKFNKVYGNFWFGAIAK